MSRAERANSTNAFGPEITEAAGDPADETQLRRLVSRYYWVASYCDGKDVLEVACGTGQGLGILRSRARSVHACDLSAENLETARKGNGPKQPLVRGDAQLLPFADQSFDVVILLEALYFLPFGDRFVSEAHRVLRPGGVCLISAVNKDCAGFNANHSFYTDLYGASELSALMNGFGFETQCFGITPVDQTATTSPFLSSIKNTAVKLNLIPESKKARIFLKRILPGRLETIPHDLSTLSIIPETPVPIASDRKDTVHQAVLCAARKI